MAEFLQASRINCEYTVSAHSRERGHDLDAHAGFVLTKERQAPATQLDRATWKQPVSTAAGPVRRLPIGAEPQPGGGVHFRVWAPSCYEVSLEIEGLEPTALRPDADGYFSPDC